MVNSGHFGRLRATVCHIATSPGLPNVVPDRAELTVDLRNPDNDHMTATAAKLAEFLEQLPSLQPAPGPGQGPRTNLRLTSGLSVTTR